MVKNFDLCSYPADSSGIRAVKMIVPDNHKEFGKGEAEVLSASKERNL